MRRMSTRGPFSYWSASLRGPAAPRAYQNGHWDTGTPKTGIAHKKVSPVLLPCIILLYTQTEYSCDDLAPELLAAAHVLRIDLSQ